METIRNDPSCKTAYGQSLFEILYHNQNKPKEMRSKFCKETVLNVPVVIYTRKNFFLVHALNSKIDLLKSAGLIELWRHENIDERFLDQNEFKQPSGLTVDNLKGFFFIFLCGCCLSVVIFINEIQHR